jgi:hypothetical protein
MNSEMARKAGSNGFRNALEERLGTSEYNRISAEGQQDPTKDGRYSAKEVISEFRERPEGVSIDEGDNSMVAKYQGLVNDGAKFNRQATSYLEKQGVNFNKPESTDSDPAASQTPVPFSAGTSTGDGSINSPISQANPQTINGNNNQANQDNSITQTIDNSVDNTDNSRRFYGGSTRTFNYTGGDGESKLYDTPVSSATMGGFYDVDDSPAASQKFMDMYIDSNRLAQRANRREYDTYKNVDYSPNNPQRDAELNAGLTNSIQESRDRANAGREKIFKGKSPFDFNFEIPGMPSPITSNAEKIYEDTLNKIK